MLCAMCCLASVVRGLLISVCWLLCVVRRVVWCVMYVEKSVFGVAWSLSKACCPLFVVW